MPICRKCSTQLADGSRFCHICGTEVISSLDACANCGCELKPGARFCNKCGAEVVSEPTSCVNCGHTLKPGAKFCGKCGATITGASFESKKDDRYDPKYKSSYTLCPVCGEIVGKEDLTCYACGASLSYDGASDSNSVHKLEADLARIELERPVQNTKSSFSSYFLGGEEAHGSPTLDKKIAYIKSFPIPETIEELLDLVMLASSNIHQEYGKPNYDSYDGIKGYRFYMNVTLSHAWLLKMDQAYSKAKLKYSSDPLFPQLRDQYAKKMRELKRSPKL